MPDPDGDRHPVQANPDRYRFQANEKVDTLIFFLENFNILAKILKISTHLILMRKINIVSQCCALKFFLTNLIFQHVSNLGFRTRIGIVFACPDPDLDGINMEIRFRIMIGIKTMPIHNTAQHNVCLARARKVHNYIHVLPYQVRHR